MKKYILLFIALLLPVLTVGADSPQKKKKADKHTAEWRYELEAYSSPYRGACNVKVWSYSRDINIARQQATKNAVHGALFRGIPANPEKRINAMPPVIDDLMAEENNKAFFDKFFEDGGPYLRFATKTTSGGSDEILKYGKNDYKYKVGVIVTVQYDELRKYMEEQGLRESLASGFAK